ncbi:low-complexity tail membrane protein [Lyngbya sp. CCY1209]|uniref:low-complexity tail membrane protein n=1 Tax=Lyngbya sp. CCY1209 TaxID=2886103 RepID=UPI002D1FFBA4|nr:low-complexity tail membrane protein [Lyngbya sp. CCY1209]MEB3886489.1 low-complexity tail membrane protein [Lyngbya sp. CCY1209]
MRRFRLDPFLWIHFAGLATLPIWFGLCLFGFAVGYPLLPVGVEFSLVAIAGILPILWMQWFRPFYIFSILVVAIRPERLADEQRRILAGFKTQRQQGLSSITPILLLPVLWQLYGVAPLAAEVASGFSEWRPLGLAIAAAAFCGANLFAQVPMSVVGIFLTPESEFANREPLSPPQIRQGFTIVGARVDRIWPVSRETAEPADPEPPGAGTSESPDIDPAESV